MIIAIAIAGAAWLALRAARERRITAPAPDPLANLDPGEAYGLAKKLFERGHALESLPYFRRATAPPGPVQVHVDYAVALVGAAVEVRAVRGLGFPATRSSFERVALMREALAELDVAERYVTNANGRAVIINQRGHLMKVWGFPLLAMRELLRAKDTDPSSRQFQLEAFYYSQLMLHPEQELEEEEP